jgi:hypothetical protein
MEYQYSTVTADGDDRLHATGRRPTCDFAAAGRVFPEYGVRLPGRSARFFRRLLAGRGFDVESRSSSSNNLTARRKSPTVVRAD